MWRGHRRSHGEAASRLCDHVAQLADFRDTLRYFAQRIERCGIHLRLNAIAEPAVLAAGEFDEIVIAITAMERAASDAAITAGWCGRIKQGSSIMKHSIDIRPSELRELSLQELDKVSGGARAGDINQETPDVIVGGGNPSGHVKV